MPTTWDDIATTWATESNAWNDFISEFEVTGDITLVTYSESGYLYELIVVPDVTFTFELSHELVSQIWSPELPVTDVWTAEESL